MKLLIVGLNYAPEPVGIGPYTAGMAEALAERGLEVRAVVGKPYYPQWRTYPGFAGLWRTTEENGVRVTRCAHYVPHQPSGLKRMLHLASFAASALLPALRQVRWKPDVVLCLAPALLSVPVAWLAARLSGAKLWIHVQDFEVEAGFATGLVSERGLTARLASWLENRLLGLADRVSTISPQMAARLAGKGVAPDRVLEIRNWADARFRPDPERGASYRSEWQLGTGKVALYSGNIANKQGIEIVIEAAEHLAARDDIMFVICGEGPNRARLEALAAGAGNVQVHDLQPAERMGELLALADVHLLPQIPGAADLVLPSKLTNMLASGRPVVATAAAGSGLYAEVDGCGVLVEPGDAGGVAAVVEALLDDTERRTALGSAALDRAGERWSKDRIIDRLEAELRRLA
jgi:colanic acid biosynthesis glycosyl transferase WcaI